MLILIYMEYPTPSLNFKYFQLTIFFGFLFFFLTILFYEKLHYKSYMACLPLFIYFCIKTILTLPANWKKTSSIHQCIYHESVYFNVCTYYPKESHHPSNLYRIARLGQSAKLKFNIFLTKTLYLII